MERNQRTDRPLAIALLAAAALVAVAPGATADSGGNCNNYGITVSTYNNSSQDCSSQEYVQHCDQGTGAGAAAGAGSGNGGGNEAGAGATAGTECNQDNSNRTSSSPAGGPTLDKAKPNIGDPLPGPTVGAEPSLPLAPVDVPVTPTFEAPMPTAEAPGPVPSPDAPLALT